MRAVRLRSPASITSLEVADLPDPPAPGPGEIMVRVRASSLNYHDLSVVTGRLVTPDGRIPLSDAAGDVLAVGPNVNAFAVGDKVISLFMPDWIDGAAPDPLPTRIPGDGIDGYACELVTMPASFFTHMPDTLDYTEAASLPCAGVSAWRALVEIAQLKAGETLLVQGSGGVSVFALQIAKQLGARVIATSSQDKKLDRLAALGADHLINYRTTPNWGDEARRLTYGRGVDAIVEVGGPGTLPQSILAMRSEGTVALLGVLTGREGVIPTGLLFAKQVRLIGQIVGHRRHQEEFGRAMEATGIKPVISHTFPLEDLAAAFEFQKSGQHFGKVAITI